MHENLICTVTYARMVNKENVVRVYVRGEVS